MRRRRRAILLLLAAAACRSADPASSSATPALRARSTRVRVGAVTLHTTRVGPEEGAVTLVVHGGPGLDHNYLRPSLDALADRRRQLVYVDLRGHGQSDAPPDASGYSLAAAAGDLAALARIVAERATVDVVAHDFGAAVALELAATHPERVRKLVLVSPVRDGRQVRAMGERARQVLGEAGTRELASLSTAQGTLRDPRQLPALFRALGPLWWAQPQPPSVTDALARHVRYRPEADEHFLVQLEAWDGRRTAQRVRAECLIVSGAQDRSFTAEESRSLADVLAHGRFVEVAAAGHLPFVEQHAAFVHAVRSFLR